MSLRHRTVQVTFLVSLISYVTSTICYFPDRSVSEYTPCPDPVSSACCPADAYCLTNGLCWTALNFLFRGSCSDQTWTDPACPSFCRQSNPFSGKVLAPCNSGGLFACDYDCTSYNFTVTEGKVVLRDYQMSSLGVSAKATGQVNATAPLTCPSTSSSTSAPTSPSSPSTSPSDSILDRNCTTSSADHSDTPADGSPKVAAVGAGVGVPLGLALLATLAFLARERRRTRVLEQEKMHWKSAKTYYQPAIWNQNANGLGGGSAELTEDRARHEIGAEPLAHELQAQIP